MTITNKPILLTHEAQVDVMRSIDACWTISEMPQ
jgi:hypothetical protein